MRNRIHDTWWLVRDPRKRLGKILAFALLGIAGAMLAAQPRPGPRPGMAGRPRPPLPPRFERERPPAQRSPQNSTQTPDLRPGQKDRARPRERTPAELANTRLTLTIGKPVGPWKPLLGINAGPMPSGEAGNADLTEQYRWAGVREVRTQDFYGPLDLSVMYPNLAADPLATFSYAFAESDKAFVGIVSAGCEPYFRLGDSWNNVRVPTTASERANYAKAAAFVVRHYRTWQPNGGAAPFRYVEIGNEPDNRKFWPAAYEDFFPYFVDTFRQLRTAFPDMKIGGPGFVVSSYKVPGQRDNVTAFLDHLKKNGIRPDFLSFHLYSDDPGEYYDIVRFYRQEAAKHGFENVELHLSEWNTETGGMEVRVGPKAAPCVTACWIALQQAGADASLLFRGTDTNIDNPGFYGIFFADGSKKPAAWAFHLWSRMAASTERLEILTGDELLDAEPATTGPLKPLWMVAGRDAAGFVRLLIANIGRQSLRCKVKGQGTLGTIAVAALEDSHAGLVTRTAASGETLVIKPLSVQVVTFSPR